MTIFKQVPIEEEKPEEGKDVLLISIDGHIYNGRLTEVSGFCIGQTYISEKYITHWLKEITLPTDEEINKAADIAYPYSKEADSDHFYDEGFKYGAEYILTQLK